jgi:hypothetical protein
MIEKDDEIVDIHSSLLTGISNEVHRRVVDPNFFLSAKDLELFIESLKFIVNLEHDLYNIIDYQ